MEEECTPTAEEAVRLREWLKSKGMTAEDISDCLRFVLNGSEEDN